MNVTNQDLLLLSAPRSHARLDGRILAGVAALHAAVIAVACLIATPQTPVPPQDAVAVLFAPAVQATTQTLASVALSAPVEKIVPLLAPQPAVTAIADAPHPPRYGLRHAVRIQPRALAPVAAQQMQAASAASAASAESAAGTAHPVTAPAPPRPIADASAAQSGDARRLLAGWEARIRQAVQDATIYPASARMHRREGRVRVQFDYDHGAVAQAAVVQTSQYAPLDAAALSAVNSAVMPSPPAEIGPQRRTMLVWVQFALVADE